MFGKMDRPMLASLLYLRKQNLKAKRKHRWWESSIIRNRKQHGTFYHLVKELDLEKQGFKDYFRVDKQQFQMVLELIAPTIMKQTRSREPLCPKQRLCICLR